MDKPVLNDKLIEAVRDSWVSGKKAILLSRLGSVDGGAISRAVREHANSLASYISAELASDVRLIKHSSNPVIIGAVPQNDETKGISDTDALLEHSVESVSNADKSIRFQYQFWTAFKKQIPDGRKRFITPGTDGFFGVIEILEQEQSPDGSIEVKQTDVVEQQIGHSSDNEIYSAVMKWGERNSIDLKQFALGRGPRRQERLSSWKQGDLSILDRMLDSIAPEDLKRMSMPMDIILKLARTKA